MTDLRPFFQDVVRSLDLGLSLGQEAQLLRALCLAVAADNTLLRPALELFTASEPDDIPFLSLCEEEQAARVEHAGRILSDATTARLSEFLRESDPEVNLERYVPERAPAGPARPSWESQH